MAVGRSAPRFEKLALLYPRSKVLQAQISEYSIVVVHLCQELLNFTQRSMLERFASTLIDADLRNFESDLETWANLIKGEMELLMAQTIEKEAEKNSRFRAVSSKIFTSGSHEQRLRTKLRVLNSCCTYNHETTWKQTRKKGNTSLFRQMTEYQAWKSSDSSCTLVYSGKLGSGKSVSLANVVDDLNLQSQAKDTVVAYFFCRHDIPESLRARTIIGSLTRQLLRLFSDLSMGTEILDNATSELDLEQLSSLLSNALPPKFSAYLVLDGLDECDDIEREKVACQIRSLQKRFTLLLCVSLRLEPEFSRRMSLNEFTAVNSISIPEQNPDIEMFIATELENSVESQKLALGDPKLIVEIQDCLLREHQGMFLWVALQIKSLCAMKTDADIRHALANLPRDLPTMFSRILRKSDIPGQTYQRQILELVTIAGRPLTVGELQEALSVVPGDTTWDASKMPNDMFSTLSCCGSLVTIDEEELTVRLIHHSVKQFLISGYQSVTGEMITIKDTHMRMASIAITYLNYNVFETRLLKIAPQIMAELMPSKIIHLTLDSSTSVRQLALKLLRSKRRYNYDLSKTLTDIKLSKSRSEDVFHFYTYAKMWLLFHLERSLQTGLMVENLLLRLLRQGRNFDENGSRLLLWAVRYCTPPFVSSLRENVTLVLDAENRRSQELLLSSAAENGYVSVIDLLLANGNLDVNCTNDDRQTPLHLAAQNGHAAVVQQLLTNEKVELACQNLYGQCPLHLAARNGHAQIVQRLLATQKLDVNCTDNRAETPLLLAAREGHLAVVQQLLDEENVELNCRNFHRHTPLSLATRNKRTAIMKLLVASEKTDLNHQDIMGQTSLHLAAKHGFAAGTALLLATSKVNINCRERNCQTPLILAAKNSDPAVLELLVANAGTDLNSIDSKGWTALCYAIAHSREASVKLLLGTKKVDVNRVSFGMKTPLFLAKSKGCQPTINLLLEYEAKATGILKRQKKKKKRPPPIKSNGARSKTAFNIRQYSANLEGELNTTIGIAL